LSFPAPAAGSGGRGLGLRGLRAVFDIRGRIRRPANPQTASRGRGGGTVLVKNFSAKASGCVRDRDKKSWLGWGRRKKAAPRCQACLRGTALKRQARTSEPRAGIG